MDVSMTRLHAMPFVDLYVGPDYADIKGMPGAHAPRLPLPADFVDEVQALRDKCLSTYRESGEPEFSTLHDDVLYRVTVMNNLQAEPVLFLRRMAAEIRDFDRLGMSQMFRTWVMESVRPGMILVCGDQAAGKTSTAASLLVARLKAHGGVGLAIEDPPETKLDGLHGEGRCIQIPASRKFGNYEEQLRRAMRAGIATLLIGEIRDGVTAREAIRHSNNGLCVISTIHARDVSEALQRILSYAPATGTSGSVRDELASGLSAVIYQRLDRVPSGDKTVVRASFRTLIVDGEGGAGIRTKIREERWGQLMQDVDSQAGRKVWDPT